MFRKLGSVLISVLLWTNFWVGLSVIFPPLLLVSLFTPKRWHNVLVRFTCKLLMYSVCLFPRYRGSNPDTIPFPVIYVANHVTFFDLFICGSVLPGNPRGLELKSHFTKPIYGWFISRFGQIPIEPGNRTSIRQSFEQASQILKNRIRSILVMPEGTRTRDGKIGPFKHGAFYLSKLSGVPIVPVVFKQLHERSNPHSLRIRPGRFDVVLMEPVDPNQFETDSELSEYVRKIMMAKLEE